MWMCLVSFAVVGLIILISGIVGLFVHFDPLKEFDFLPPETNPDHGKRRFYDVQTKLNFTQAEDYCNEELDGALLAFPRSFQEEDRLEKDITFQMDENGTNVKKHCGNRLFLGIRKSVDAQWILADGTSALAMPKLSEVAAGDFDLCSKLIFDGSSLDFRSTRCLGSAWSCIICEYS